MVRHLTTLVLGGILGSMVLVGNAEACWKRNAATSHRSLCGSRGLCDSRVCPAPRFLASQVACCNPAPTCAPKVKCCKITLPKLCLPKFCQQEDDCRLRSSWPARRPCVYSAYAGTLATGFWLSADQVPSRFPADLTRSSASCSRDRDHSP